MSIQGFPPSKRQIRSIVSEYSEVNEIRYPRYASPGKVVKNTRRYPVTNKYWKPRKDWVVDFMERRKLSTKKLKGMNIKRFQNLRNPFLIEDFYDKLEMITATLGIASRPECYWNLDESGFPTDPNNTETVSMVGQKVEKYNEWVEAGRPDEIPVSDNEDNQDEDDNTADEEDEGEALNEDVELQQDTEPGDQDDGSNADKENGPPLHDQAITSTATRALVFKRPTVVPALLPISITSPANPPPCGPPPQTTPISGKWVWIPDVAAQSPSSDTSSTSISLTPRTPIVSTPTAATPSPTFASLWLDQFGTQKQEPLKRGKVKLGQSCVITQDAVYRKMEEAEKAKQEKEKAKEEKKLAEAKKTAAPVPKPKGKPSQKRKTSYSSSSSESEEEEEADDSLEESDAPDSVDYGFSV